MLFSGLEHYYSLGAQYDGYVPRIFFSIKQQKKVFSENSEKSDGAVIEEFLHEISEEKNMIKCEF